MVPASISLVNLPLELIYDISDFLPPDAVLALKLTHRNFNSTLSLESKLNKAPLSDCARLAIRTSLQAESRAQSSSLHPLQNSVPGQLVQVVQQSRLRTYIVHGRCPADRCRGTTTKTVLLACEQTSAGRTYGTRRQE